MSVCGSLFLPVSVHVYLYVESVTVYVISVVYAYIVFVMMHMLIAFVLLLNFMIAILSNTYATMLESGSFKYKCSLFEYCERYIIAF